MRALLFIRRQGHFDRKAGSIVSRRLYFGIRRQDFNGKISTAGLSTARFSTARF
jgi:hypothetical protein